MYFCKKKMKKIIFNFVLIITMIIISCNSNNSLPQNRVIVNRIQSTGNDITVNQDVTIPGFDVNAFADLLKQTADPDKLTIILNTPDNGVNDMHLNNPSSIDYLKVDQLNNNQLGVFDETPSGKIRVATLTINRETNSYQILGDQNYCGADYAYNSPSGLRFTDYALLYWLYRPHVIFHPYWGYHAGYYSGYHPYAYSTTSRTRYITRYRVTHPSSYTNRPSQTQAPRNIAPARSSLSNPTSTQRSFQKNEGDRFRNSTMSSNRTSTSRSTSPFRSTSSSSRGGFGRRK